jgi:hypothetical protein
MGFVEALRVTNAGIRRSDDNASDLDGAPAVARNEPPNVSIAGLIKLGSPDHLNASTETSSAPNQALPENPPRCPKAKIVGSS